MLSLVVNVYRSNEEHLHCDWIEDIKKILTATNYKHFQHRAEKLITELMKIVSTSQGAHTTSIA